MRSLTLGIAMLLLAAGSYAQTEVDRLARSLDSLALAAIDHWKVSPDLKSYAPNGDPTRPGFDDSKWANLTLDQQIYPDSCWIRKEIVLPDKILGTPLSGPLRLRLSVDDYGYLWVNGESKGYFPWNGDFPLTSNATPGQHLLIAIKAVNTGGPLRLIHAEVVTEGLKSLRQSLGNLAMSLKVGQKLLSFDTYQTSSARKTDPGTDQSGMDKAEKTRLMELLQSAAKGFNTETIVTGPRERFEAEFSAVRRQLKPVADYAKRFTILFDANAHIDASWLWRDKETIEVCNNTFRSVFNMMDARPDFTYTQSSAAYYEWMERLYPDTFRKMQRRVKDGRWEVVGGMWIEPDCNLLGGESWARQLLYAKRYFRSKMGVDVTIGWNPDSFGYNGNMPMFYRQAGIDAFITQKIGWNDTNVFPYRLFWWQSPDGSRVLSYFPFDYVNEIKNPFELVDWVRQFEANTGMTKMMILFGVGDHGGGPSLEMMERIDQLRQLDVYPAIEYGTAADYLSWVRKQDLSRVPVWTNELYLEYHQGTFTTQAKMKERNRTSEVLMTNAEKFTTLATTLAAPYHTEALSDAWKSLMFNQFHDILPGSGIRETYIDANEKYDTVQAIGTHELKRGLETIAADVNTARFRKGTPLVVFNPLSWDRDDVVRLALPEADESDYAVFDAKGKEVPSQIRRIDRYHREVFFVARGVPSVGYTVFELRKQKPTLGASALTVNSAGLENEYFRVSIDPETGWVTSVLDKRSGREILGGKGNELQLLEDKPSAWDAWNIGLTGVQYPSTFRRIEVVERGPVRVVLRLYRDYVKPGTRKAYPTEDFPSSFFTQDIVLYAGLDRIDFTTTVDWWEDKTMLKVAFPLAVSDTVATYEIPYGTIQRSTQMRNSWERAQVEVPAMRWADLSQNDYGVGLVNNSKYGYDIKGNTIRLSLLRSPKWPDPAADRGKHTIHYALYPHQGRWNESQLVHRGYEYNYPLLAVTTNVHKGSLAEAHSFVRLEPANLVLTTIKKAEDGNDWIVQWYDAMGSDSKAVLTLPAPVRKAVRSNFLEEDGPPVHPDRNRLEVDTPKHSVVTVKVAL